MRLAAIYIKKHFLFSEPQTVNFGGKYFYTIIPRKDRKNEYDITREENTDFIDGFWGEKISLVSAIVGENGTGKTSILREISANYNRAYKTIFFIYEIEDEIKIIDRDVQEEEKPVFFTDFKYDIGYVPSSIEYFNLSVEYSTADINSTISHTHYYNNISTDYYRKLQNQIMFLFSEFGNNLKKNYKDNFPFFDNVTVINKYHIPEEYNDVKINGEKSNITDVYKYAIELYYNDHITFEKNHFFKNLELTILLQKIKVYPHKDNIDAEKYKALKTSKEFSDMLVADSNNDDVFINLSKFLDDFYDRTKNLSDNFTIEDNAIILSSLSEERVVKFIRFLDEIIALLIDKFFFITENPFFDIELYSDKNEEIRFSTGEKRLLDLYSSFYSMSKKNNVQNNGMYKFPIFFLDEPESGYHPQWKKKFIASITKILPKILAEIPFFESVQIIFTTHDPLTLSDIPNSNVVYLKKDGGKTKVLNENEKPKKSFGANIHDLLADSFFISDGLIGDFAKEKIEEIIEWINDEKARKIKNLENYQLDSQSYSYHKKLIGLIDEPVLKMKLAEMIDELADDENLQKELAQKEIDYLKLKYGLE